MTVRFVLDESSWQTTSTCADLLPAAVEALVHRMEIAAERAELVSRHSGFYETDLGHALKLFSVLFELDCPLKLDRDLGERLRLALDRTGSFDDAELSSYDAFFAGSLRLAPGVAWAHARHGQRHAVAVLPLQLDFGVRGQLAVSVEGTIWQLHFVTSDEEHLEFFRNVFKIETTPSSSFEEVARSAFPELSWADDVWSGLNDFSKPYRDIRADLVDHLSVLNDHAATLFSELLAASADEIGKRLKALGAEASDENGETKKYAPSRRDHTRRFEGVEITFWWHTKIQPHVDRIYFTYQSRGVRSGGRIVVGIFKDHCDLPG